MVSIKYSRRGKKKIWDFLIRQGNQTLLYQSGFRTKDEAKAYALAEMPRFIGGTVPDRNMTVSNLVEIWVNAKRLGHKSEKTDDKYKNYIQKIDRYFSKEVITELKPSTYQVIMNEIGLEVGIDYLGRINSVIRQSINYAKNDGILVADFTKNVQLNSHVKPQQPDDKFIHSVNDYDKIIKYVLSKFDYQFSITPYILYFLFKTGFRFGELIATTWDEVDFKNKTIRTYHRYNTTIKKFVPPKNTTSVRINPLSVGDVEILQTLKKVQAKFYKELRLENSRNLVFAHFTLADDVPNIATVNKALEKMLLELHISPLITTKGARHTFGSYCLYKGIDLQLVAKMLGHKDASMLIKVYAHILDELQIEQFDKIRGLLD